MAETQRPDMKKKMKHMKKRFGFVSKIEIVNRGSRRVGIVKVIPMGSTIEKEVLAVCISLVSQQQIHDI